MRIHPFHAVYPNVNLIASNDSFFGTVKTDYPEYHRSGFYNTTKEQHLYVCLIENPHRSHKGLLCCVDIRDYKEGLIKKHEKTLSAKVQQQMHLMLVRRAMVKPVLFTYDGHNEIDQIIENTIQNSQPFLSVNFEESQEKQSFWRLTHHEEIKRLKALFGAHVPHAYIADGHHRCLTTEVLFDKKAKKGKEAAFQNLLCAFFPKQEVEILDYNRVVEGLNDLSPTQFMAKLSRYFKITCLVKANRPTQKHELTMFFNNEWFRLKWRKAVLKPTEGLTLDASLLDEKILENILGIEDVRTDQRIKYVEGPKGLEEIKERTLRSVQRVAFCLYPVSLGDLFSVVDAGDIMPPKSTWFEPRMKNGLIVKACE